ncbi:MAG: prephenate dehydrogenase [Methanobrevibacter sp.]|nr:prephenate dehydrogenase [Methanobrevibacter sp.]
MKIAIIGGTKGLGKTLAMILSHENFDITITGRDKSYGEKVAKELGVKYSNNNQKTASLNEIVIIAVPIANVNDVIKEIATFLQKGSLLLDVTSVKVGPSEAMDKLLPGHVEFIPTHPVFGPRTSSLNGQVVVLTPLKKGKWYLKIFNFLKNHKVRIIESSPKEHDDMMAVVQILTHFSYISTAVAMEKLGVNISQTRKFASPIYNLMVDMISRITSQNPFLTYSIQIENESGEKVREVFAESVNELKDVLFLQEEDDFVKIVSAAVENMDDIQAALGRSDKAIDSLTRELTLLKKSIGEEIAIKHIYSEKEYIGVLEELDPDYLTIATENGFKKLKIANIKILDVKPLDGS